MAQSIISHMNAKLLNRVKQPGGGGIIEGVIWEVPESVPHGITFEEMDEAIKKRGGCL
jgi:hypothetical protein